MRILVAGELNPDLIMQGYRQFPALGKEVLVDDLVLALGSSSAICAAGLAKLGNQVAFIGKVGADPWGDFCLERLQALQVDTSLVIGDVEVKTGLTVSVTSSSDRALVTYLGAIALLKASDIDPALLPRFDHLHVSSFFIQSLLQAGCAGLFDAAHSAGLTTSFDPGYDPSEEWDSGIEAAIGAVDVFLPNEVELAALEGKLPDSARTLVVAKLGASGAAARLKGELTQVPGYRVEPVDTTGAGDSFNAGFLHAWLQKRPLAEALRFGCACGALSTLGMGGTGAQSTEQQATEFLRNQ